MARQTKQELIEELYTRLATRGTEADALQDKVDVAVELSTRLNDTLKKSRGNIDKLKGVARFYRAQRDRVGAYLSAVLDTIERQQGGGMKDETETLPVAQLRDVVMHAERAMERAPGSHRRRPRVQEPSVRLGGIKSDGRDFAAYRDDEPEDWENF